MREGATLMPAILPETARDIHGKVGKGAPVPIEKVTPDIGSTLIWGEIFALETK